MEQEDNLKAICARLCRIAELSELRVKIKAFIGYHFSQVKYYVCKVFPPYFRYIFVNISAVMTTGTKRRRSDSADRV